MATCYVLAEDLRPGLETVRRFAATRSSLPILNNILLMAKDDSLLVGASNLETFAWVKIPAAIDPEFAITVPARTLCDTLERKSTGVLELETNVATQSLRLDIAGRVANLLGLDASDFPNLPDCKTEATRYPTRAWVEAVQHVVPFASPTGESPARPILKALQWTLGRLVAADNIRVGIAELKGDGPDLPTCLVPALALGTISQTLSMFATEDVKARVKAMKDSYKVLDIPRMHYASVLRELECKLRQQYESVHVQYHVERNCIIVWCGPLSFAVQCATGDYPNVDQYICQATPTEAVVATEDLLPTLKSLHVINRDKWGDYPGRVQMRLNGTLELTAESKNVGRSTFTLPCSKTGPDIDTAINGEWLRNLVKGLHSESVTLRFASPHLPILVSATTKPHLTAAIMPMRA